jgi:hypothetical protein
LGGEAVSEKPILFSGPMVRAILEGRKTMTRRFCDTWGEHLHNGKKLCDWDLSSAPYPLQEDHLPVRRWRGYKEPKVGDWVQDIQTHVDDHATFPIRNPYGQLGDRLWVRETFALEVPGCDRGVSYRADHIDPSGDAGPLKWKPSIFMPRWASRITLEITNVRVERLQDISEEDAIAEGVEQLSASVWRNYFEDCALCSATHSFSSLWQSINGKNRPGGEWDAWESNCWVWAVRFHMITEPA